MFTIKSQSFQTIHNHSNLFAMLGCEDVIQQRRFTGAEIT